MNKIEFVMGELTTIACELRAIATEYVQEEASWKELEEKSNKERVEEGGQPLRMGRPVSAYLRELEYITGKLHGVTDYLKPDIRPGRIF